MNRKLVPFFCGAVCGAVAASAAWSVAGAAAGVTPAPPPEVHSAAAGAPESVPEPPPAESAAASEDPMSTFDAVPAAGAPPPSAQPEGDAAVGGGERRRERRGPPRWDEMTEEQREEARRRFHRMADERAQRMAASFVERNGLEEADGETLLAIADGMNERALARIQRWSDYLELQGAAAIPKDQGARMMRDLFDDLVAGYEELDEAFGAAWRENDPEFDLGQMVSPEVWGSLFRLGGGFGGPGARRGPRGPRGPGGPGGSR